MAAKNGRVPGASAAPVDEFTAIERPRSVLYSCDLFNQVNEIATIALIEVELRRSA